MPRLQQPHTLLVHASTEHLAEVRNFVAAYADEMGFEQQPIADIRLAVDEAFTNIIEHAYNNDASQSVKVSLEHNAQSLSISLFDSGKSFSLQQYTEPNVEQRIKQKKRGGVGVYLIKTLMDEVEYFRQGSQNEIRMTKNR